MLIKPQFSTQKLENRKAKNIILRKLDNFYSVHDYWLGLQIKRYVMVVTKNNLPAIICGKGLIWGFTLLTLIISWLKGIMRSGCIRTV